MKKFIAFFISCLIALGATGCGKNVGGADKRDSIYISLFNGGYGREWLDTIVNDYNAEKTDNKYKLTIRANKDEFNAILSGLQSGTAIYDLFFTNSFLYKMIDADLVEDISDVWDTKPAGSDKTIRQMMVGSEDYAAAYGDGKGGLYALPVEESVRGFVYDHELFKNYGLLFNEEGQFITSPDETLSKGKDGKAGTYDDGQPITEAQWDALVKKCTQMLGYAFVYSGKFAGYLNDVYDMISAQYDGVDAYMLNYTYDGTYNFGTDAEPDVQPVSMDNGYRLAEMKGKKFAVEFMDKYLACKDTTLGIVNPYTYPNSSGLSYSHSDAQTDFIVNTARNKTQKMGMLIEGDWWENESKMTFNDLAAINYKDYAFRTHDYRFMTLPLFEGQKEEGSVYAIADNMYVGLKKSNDNEKKAICKDFLNYMFQPKYIQNFTVNTGGVMPYDVQLTEAQKEQLSPFSKNFLELYHDPANKFINTQLFQNKYIAIRAGAPLTTVYKDGYIIINGLYTQNAESLLKGMLTSRKNDWETIKSNYDDYVALRG